MDQPKALADRAEQKAEMDAPLREFTEQSVRLAAALSASVPRPEPPPALHSSIMFAVKAAAAEPRARPRTFVRWVPAPALIALALIAAWYFSRPGPETPALDSASTTLEWGAEVAHNASDAAVAPLNEEWSHLNRDWEATLGFLEASVP